MAEHYIIDDKEHVYEAAYEKHHTKKTVTLNGTYNAEDEPGDITGYSEVTVDVEGGGSATLITKNITENGTYNASSDQADGYSSVVVDVSPGEVEVNDYAIDFTPDTNAGTVTSGGILFTVLKQIKVSKIRVFARSSSVNVYISTSTRITIAEVLNASVEVEQWNDVALSAPVTLYPDISYIVWYSHTDSTLVKYKRYSTITPNLDCIDVKNGRYSQTPNDIPYNNENGVIYGVDLYVESVTTGPTLVEKTITANGTYDSSDDNADGYSEVTVNVSDKRIIPSIPAEYQKVEYIQLGSTSTNYKQYITIPSVVANSQIEAKYCYIDYNGGEKPIIAGHIIGHGNTDYDFELYLQSLHPTTWLRDTTKVQFDYCIAEQGDLNTLSDGEYYDLNFISGITVFSNYPENPSDELRIFIGTYSPNSAYSYNFYGRCYYVCVINKTTGEYDYFFVPCYRKSDNKVGLYDAINNIFYPNEGDGDFGKGPDVN